MNSREKALSNRAEPQNTANCYCDNCGENMIFAMEDNYHQFTLGIEEVLICLLIAENNGAVPGLTDDWWIAVRNRYSGVSHQIEEKKNKHSGIFRAETL